MPGRAAIMTSDLLWSDSDEPELFDDDLAGFLDDSDEPEFVDDHDTNDVALDDSNEPELVDDDSAS